jgi:hypothetical protein
MNGHTAAIPVSNADYGYYSLGAFAFVQFVPSESGVLRVDYADVEPIDRVRVTPDQREEQIDPLSYEYPLIPRGLVYMKLEAGELPRPDWDY